MIGAAHPDRLLRKGGARPGDTLLLTKRLGTGVLVVGLAAGPDERRRSRHRDRADAHAEPGRVRGARRERGRGRDRRDRLRPAGPRTGDGPRVRARASYSRPPALPALDGALDLAAAGVETGGAAPQPSVRRAGTDRRGRRRPTSSSPSPTTRRPRAGCWPRSQAGDVDAVEPTSQDAGVTPGGSAGSRPVNRPSSSVRRRLDGDRSGSPAAAARARSTSTCSRSRAAITIVDAGLPGYWGDLAAELAAMGRSLDDVRAVVLTHAHDRPHRLRRASTDWERGVPIRVHEADAALARGEVEAAERGRGQDEARPGRCRSCSTASARASCGLKRDHGGLDLRRRGDARRARHAARHPRPRPHGGERGAPRPPARRDARRRRVGDAQRDVRLEGATARTRNFNADNRQARESLRRLETSRRRWCWPVTGRRCAGGLAEALRLVRAVPV